MEAEEGNSVTLRCELSKPGISVEWRKAAELLRTGDKYQTRQRDCVVELVIRKALPEDSGVYSCVCKDQKTAAIVSITGIEKWFPLSKQIYSVLFQVRGILSLFRE